MKVAGDEGAQQAMSPRRQYRNHSTKRRWHSLLLMGLIAVGLVLSGWLLMTTIALRSAASGPVDAFLMLGGSIRREIYMAEVAKRYPQTPILISQGSQDPCIWLIFQRAQAPIRQVWLEKCADSTFDNFYFAIPILQQWQAHKVRVITSPTHLPRARWLAQILLGAHGIWAEVEAVDEKGVPANQESALKTALDVTRSLAWAVVSQVYAPRCDRVLPLTEVNIQEWRREGFKCEHQAGIK